MPISTQTWADVLSTVFKGMVYTSWGHGSPVKGINNLSWYKYSAVIRLKNPDDEDQMLSLIDSKLITGEMIPVWSDNFSRYGRLHFSRDTSCCVDQFLECFPLAEKNREDADVVILIFGDKCVFDSVKALYSESLQVD